MATSSASQSRRQWKIDGITAKNAVAKAAKPLRTLLTNQGKNLESLIQCGLLQPNEAQGNIIKVLKEKVEQDANLFWILLDKVSGFSNGAEAEKRLRAHSCAMEDDGGQLQVLGDLRENLKLLDGIKSTESDSAIRIMISQTIDKEMNKTAACTKLMEDDLSQMHQDELISGELYEYAIAKIREKREASNADFDKLVEHCPPAQLRDDDLYHASLCCTVVNKSNDTDQCQKLLRALSYKSLEQLSISQSDDTGEFPKCMIAVSSDSSKVTTCYVAFESMLDFKQWERLNDVHKSSSFGKALECQINNFPTLYLEDIIKRENRLILTGFSFGGVLAQMLAAKLWQLPQVSIAQLKSNVLCITFGQPLLKSNLITKAAELFPVYKNTVHAICSENDNFPSIIEKLDSLTSNNEVRLSHVLQNLSCVQEYYYKQPPDCTAKSSESCPEAACQDQCRNHCSSSESHHNSIHDTQDCDQSTNLDPKILGVQSELQKLLCSQHRDPDVDMKLTPKRYLIKFKDSDLKLGEMPQSLQESLEFNRMDALINKTCFDQHSEGAYYSAVKTFAYEYRVQGQCSQISSEFLDPVIERVKVIQYGKEAIIAIKGQRLWFVHSVKLFSMFKEPLHIQETFVSIKAELDESVASGKQKVIELVVFSRFSQAISRKICVELDPNRLSPRGRQLARLEPARLLELGFMTALLEKSANRFNQSHTHLGESLHFLNFFKRFLRDIASVVPYESILCTIAHCRNRHIAELCMHNIKKINIEFPFSLTTYTSLFVAAFRIQQERYAEANMVDLHYQLSFEECANFMWLKAKYNRKSIKSFSHDLFTDSYLFGSLDELYEDALYLRRKAQISLEQISSLDEAKAISNKSTKDLFTTSYGRQSREESSMLKSPILTLIERREILHHTIDKSNLQVGEERPQPYERTIEVLSMARGGQFDLCIGVICGFMYQHVRVPFTEVNPVNILKTFQYHIGPFKDVLKNDSNFWASIVQRCRNAVEKGSRVSESTYHGKLKFLVTEIDPSSKAYIDPISSEHSMYMLETKLKELCDSRGITKEKPIAKIVDSWKSLFQECPIADVSVSHQSLISRWMKWSLMIHELRQMLETHVTIAIAGLVNSGKTQLIRTLFGFDVKAGTTELHRTIVPFMYSLAPEVEGVYVVDLPGADDSDKNVSQLTEFLKFISQIVLFVVSYDKAHTKDAKKWLETFETRSQGPDKFHRNHNVVSDHYFESNRFGIEDADVPVLVCMTFADRLLAEMLDEDGKYDAGKAKKGIAENLEKTSMTCYNQGMWRAKGGRTLGYYCFNLSPKSRLNESDMKAVGIGIPSDVGEWICKQLRGQLPDESETPNKLEDYLKQSCRKLNMQ